MTAISISSGSQFGFSPPFVARRRSRCVGFLLSAQSIKKQVDNAPMDTVEDFEALRKLEDRGVLRTRIGDVLVPL